MLAADYYAFYKGTLVVRTNMERSGSFGIIFLARNTNYIDNPEDMVRHEYGHIIQLEQLGVIRYSLCIFIPSWQKWGSKSYYDKPWEVTADVYGGVQSRLPTHDTIVSGFAYLGLSQCVGPFAWVTIE